MVKNPPANAGDIRDCGSIPWWRRSPAGGHSNPLQYSCLENPMDRRGRRGTVHVCMLSCFSPVRLFVTPWTVARQAPLSMGFSGQEYWSGLPFPSPGDLPNPGIEPRSPALAGRFFTTSPTWEAPTPEFSQSMGLQRVRHG